MNHKHRNRTKADRSHDGTSAIVAIKRKEKAMKARNEVGLIVNNQRCNPELNTSPKAPISDHYGRKQMRLKLQWLQQNFSKPVQLLAVIEGL
jgi:hypothetical protein